MAAEVLLALALTLANGTTTDDTPYSKADSLMAAFEKADRQERVAVANEIFVHNKQIGLTDFDIEFTADDNTLGSNVNFWYGEYCYEQCDFENAKKYALLAAPYFKGDGDLTGVSDSYSAASHACVNLGRLQVRIRRRVIFFEGF